SDLSRWAEELRGWDVHILRIQHLIWFSPSQFGRSMELLQRDLPGQAPELFRQEERSYMRDVLPAIDVAVLIEELRKLRAGNYPFRIELHPDLSLDDMARYYGDPEFRREDRLDCTTMESYAFVDPRGRLYPCITLDMGNVFDTPFPEIWNGPRLRAFRRLIRREHRLPLCHRCPD
ncbi:MAG TPA: SPASM domain-containing protein, partial [Thermoanaerobaculia bacterium]|nr:SPASM domain-containing protein [Thermoanaerobaculia bacterium]